MNRHETTSRYHAASHNNQQHNTRTHLQNTPHPQSLNYHSIKNKRQQTVAHIAKKTPKPKGATQFSSIEIVHAGGQLAHDILSAPRIDARAPVREYLLPPTHADPVLEFEAIFKIEEQMMLNKANRQSLVIWIGRDDAPELDGFAGFLGMLPFRGITVALVSPSPRYPDPFCFATPSGTFASDARDPARMCLSCVKAVFGPLSPRVLSAAPTPWAPLEVAPLPSEPMVRLPFKISALSLPMITYTGRYADGVDELAKRIAEHYASLEARVFPVVSCGEEIDRLGYAHDIAAALKRRGCEGYYFCHRSGELNKKWSEYGSATLLRAVQRAKLEGRQVLFVAVGGGCNGNATGVVAAMTNSHFIEVPTTPLHYNDATTSAKKAFSLVIDGKIRSKNLLGTFLLPKLVWCINETLLTSNTAAIHSTVGECTKTMNMLAVASSEAGQASYSNILGAGEFASDTTRILSEVGGFEALVRFIESAEARTAKAAVLAVGDEVSRLRQRLADAIDGADADAAKRSLDARLADRSELLHSFRELYYSLEHTERAAIESFLTTSNAEIVGAKAMFLAYEDPLEKYRALLFEYAHTLGHGVEAWLAGAIERGRAAGLPAEMLERATRNHGQCVGMAVAWAGALSRELGVLTGDGFAAHQAVVYLWNSFGGFSFGPVRALCDALGITSAEFLEGVLAVVRLDNKRGYCDCPADSSVDQLVCERPGRMVRSDDANAELRYMMVIDEDQQSRVLERAFECEFDQLAVADSNGGIAFRAVDAPRANAAEGQAVAAAIRATIRRLEAGQEHSDSLLSRAATCEKPLSSVTDGDSMPPLTTVTCSESSSSSDSDDLYSSSPKKAARDTSPTSVATTLPDFSHLLVRHERPKACQSVTSADASSPEQPVDYRKGYQAWRTGAPHGAKGEPLLNLR